MRFAREFDRLATELTRAGHVVLTPTPVDPDVELTEAERARLGREHRRRIEESEEILVVNVGGYLGDSTRREIAHARRHRVAVRFLEPPDTRGATAL